VFGWFRYIESLLTVTSTR